MSAFAVALALLTSAADARTVHRCVRDGSVSLSTAAEPGSACTAIELDDDDPRRPNLLRAFGPVSGTLYRRIEDGAIVYGTRELPGAVAVQSFTVTPPPGSPAHDGLGRLGRPRLDVFADEFRRSAQATGVDEAWLRAIAHAESGFDRHAVSPKGARGLMQLMPATAAEYRVDDPFEPGAAISGAARLLRDLMRRYRGDLSLVAAAYNAGIGALDRYGGVPPYAETQAYVGKVLALHQRYRHALAERISAGP